jgi:hypothetical protein
MIFTMTVFRWQRAAWTLVGALTLAVAFLSLEGFIRLDARHTGTRAATRFGGDRIQGLSALIDCASCSLHDRDMAVWALGELRNSRALPVLKAHYTGQRCNHTIDLCQYELGKAIKKIEGTWNLHASLTFRRNF